MSPSRPSRPALMCCATLVLLCQPLWGAEPASDPDRLLDDFIATFDLSKLAALAERLTPEEICARLKQRPRLQEGSAKAPITTVFQRLTKAEREFYAAADCTEDSTGALHMAVAAHYLVEEPDHLGNKQRWVSEIHWLTRTQHRWGEPLRIPMEDLNVQEVRLLVDREDTLWLFLLAFNAKATGPILGVPQGRSTVLCLRRPRNGEWTRPEPLLGQPPRIIHSFDACYTPTGQFHIVWAHWVSTRTPEMLRHRTCSPRGPDPHWQREEALPGLPDRNLTYPRLLCRGAQLHVFAAAQSMAGGDIGVCYLRYLDRWEGPRLVHDGTGFDLRPIRGSAHPSIAALDYAASEGSHWRIYEARADGTAKALAELALPFSWRSHSSGYALCACAADSNGRVYALAADGANLLLLRVGREGRTEGVCLAAHEGTERAWVSRGDLSLVHGRYRAWWVLSPRSGLPHRFHFHEAELPDDGWQPLPQLLGRLRAGRTLTAADFSLLASRILLQAERHTEAGKFIPAIDRYLYLVCCVPEGEARFTAQRRLHDWDEDGITEVSRRCSKILSEKPELLNGPPGRGSAVSELATLLGLGLDGSHVRRRAESPPQSDAEIKARLEALAWPPFVVPAQGGFEVRITPDRHEARRAGFTRQAFEQKCRQALGRVQRPEQAPEAVLLTIHETPPPGGWAVPPYERRLKEFAEIEILPQPR